MRKFDTLKYEELLLMVEMCPECLEWTIRLVLTLTIEVVVRVYLTEKAN